MNSFMSYQICLLNQNMTQSTEFKESTGWYSRYYTPHRDRSQPQNQITSDYAEYLIPFHFPFYTIPFHNHKQFPVDKRM